MNIPSILTDLQAWFKAHYFELIVSLIIIVLYLFSRRVIGRLIRRQAEKHDFNKARTLYIRKVTGLVNFLVFAAFFGFIWEVSLSGLGVYFASIFTVLGVGLVANWSILSNITASVILFFFFPYKIGSRIRIQDGDNSIEGLILDITMFYLEIEIDDGRVVAYPNNLAMQKAFYTPDRPKKEAVEAESDPALSSKVVDHGQGD